MKALNWVFLFYHSAYSGGKYHSKKENRKERPRSLVRRVVPDGKSRIEQYEPRLAETKYARRTKPHVGRAQ